MAGTVTGALSSPSAVDIAVVAIATESLPAVAVPSLVETSKETPPSPAGSLRLRTKSNAVLPLLPSARPTLATVSTGWPPPAHTFGAEALLRGFGVRSEEHTSELQSLMRISYAVFCLKKKNNNNR